MCGGGVSGSGTGGDFGFPAPGSPLESPKNRIPEPAFGDGLATRGGTGRGGGGNPALATGGTAGASFPAVSSTSVGGGGGPCAHVPNAGIAAAGVGYRSSGRFAIIF